MAALETAAKEGLAGLDATRAALLENVGSLVGTSIADEQDFMAEKSRNNNKHVKEENYDNGTVSAFQSGVDDFVLGLSGQMAALETAAKEGLAGLDATRAALLENAGSLVVTSIADEQDLMAEKSRNVNKGLKRKDKVSETSSYQMFRNRLLQSFDCNDGGSSSSASLWEV